MNRIDLWSILSLIGLGVFGAFNIFGIRPELIVNYILYLLLGWGIFIIIYINRLKLPLLEQNYKLLYIVFIALFLLTFVLGSDSRGSTRWIPVFSFRFQTSEFFKPVLLITLASVLSSANRFTPRKTFIAGGLCLVPCILVFLQPNLSSVLLYLSTFLVMFYFSGLSTRLMVKTGLAGILSLPVVWLLMKEYQRNRIIGFLNPESDPQGLSYNITQSIITIGSGGFMGKGLGLGTQSRFHFLPEFHTDFAFASLVEQFGMVGGMITLILFAVVIFKLIQKAFLSRKNEFVYLYTIGTLALLVVELTINVGMNMGLMPVTGIALPFISYGGSSILSTMIMLGLALAL